LERLRRDPKSLFFGNFIGAPSATIFRREITERFDRRMKWLVDIDFYMRVLAAGRSWAVASRPLVRIGVGPGRVTGESLGNREVEIYEWVLLYTKLADGDRWRTDRLNVLWKKFMRHRVCCREDVDDCGVDFALPTDVRVLLFARRLSARASRSVESVFWLLVAVSFRLLRVFMR
jgi:hypothetical protein